MQNILHMYDSCPKESLHETEYGVELPLNAIIPNAENIFSNILYRKVTIIKKRSGVFFRPHNCLIHHENFSSLREWCFIAAVEDTTFNVHHHIPSKAKSALDTTNINFRNIIEWDYSANILLRKNQGLFYRPWLFTSLEKGLVQKYFLHVD
jgi:hypothetical protein